MFHQIKKIKIYNERILYNNIVICLVLHHSLLCTCLCVLSFMATWISFYNVQWYVSHYFNEGNVSFHTCHFLALFAV